LLSGGVDLLDTVFDADLPKGVARSLA